MSLQSANLNNGANIYLTSTLNEVRTKANSIITTLNGDDRGDGAIYWANIFPKTYLGATTCEPLNLKTSTKAKCPNDVFNNIYSCAHEDALSLHDTSLKRRVNRLDIEWEIEKDFDESDALKEFLENTKSFPHFIKRDAMPAAPKFQEKYNIVIKSEAIDEHGMMLSNHYDYANRYVVSYTILGVTEDEKVQLYLVRWYDKPSLQYVEDTFDDISNMVRVSDITLIPG